MRDTRCKTQDARRRRRNMGSRGWALGNGDRDGDRDGEAALGRRKRELGVGSGR